MIPEVSVVIPLFNEEANLERLAREVRTALDGLEWELILVDDGSTDTTLELALGLAETESRIRLVPLARNYGQTAALQAGFDQSRGSVIVTMDGDLQNDPRDISRLLARLEDGYDLVAGYRVDRQDRLLTRRVPSRVANLVIRWITGVRVRDNGCSLKAFQRRLLQDLSLYSDMHRYLSPLAVATADARVTEIPVRHRPREHGKSKYGLARIWLVLADLITMTMINRFRKRPLFMFVWGAAAAMVGALVFTIAGAVALLSFSSVKADALVFPGAALLWFGLAFYLLMLGIIAEVAVMDRRKRDVEVYPRAVEEVT